MRVQSATFSCAGEGVLNTSSLPLQALARVSTFHQSHPPPATLLDSTDSGLVRGFRLVRIRASRGEREMRKMQSDQVQFPPESGTIPPQRNRMGRRPGTGFGEKWRQTVYLIDLCLLSPPARMRLFWPMRWRHIGRIILPCTHVPVCGAEGSRLYLFESFDLLYVDEMKKSVNQLTHFGAHREHRLKAPSPCTRNRQNKTRNNHGIIATVFPP